MIALRTKIAGGLLALLIAGQQNVSICVAQDGDTIGPADGISYEVVSTEEVNSPAPECGFNDLGVPILGTYTRETRRYKQYVDGKLLPEWTEKTDTFKTCN